MLRDALEGLKIMHREHWIHGDLKPDNIGMVGKPPRAVLLDFDSSRYCDPDSELPAEPGTEGTIGYLAPEREMGPHSAGPVDIWAMGVIGYQLTYGKHPWKFAVNPWCRRGKLVGLRRDFLERYNHAMATLKRDCEDARRAPAKGYIHRTLTCPRVHAQSDK